MTVLVIDADRVCAEIVSIMLSWEGADVITAHDAAEALSLARRHRFDVAILDPRLPETDALSLLGTLRQGQSALPVLMLVPTGSTRERLTRFATGFEYLTKPFSVEELSLKLRILLSRGSFGLEGGLPDIVVGDLVLNEEGREVTRAGRALALRYTEFELLRYFMRNPHRLLTKQQILARVWPYGFSGRPNIVELYVSSLRKKINQDAAPMIHTLRLSGYILKPALGDDTSRTSSDKQIDTGNSPR
ncbi:two-component system response regulator [Mycolicibacterium canariasense]|uniref:Two-component system response regulator n=1 Tax=Mycolicibacterium canariasense TaxID=228230 RepID=A0A124E327_MYCCR|nr:response regulator transcription factor [Mycolicibacterium canariasense]MCV7212193.1 response regulator transcription factor [Mycolicibacterium canariasense]GAS98688.1 two-component system response regulator [Mycolicibacterium canariasense]